MRAVAALAIAIMAAGSAQAGSATKQLTITVAPAAGAGPTNTMIVADATGAGLTNYPLQFGRPFLRGAIPAGQCPIVTINGTAAASQADVKEAWPDGSVKHAVMAVVIPSVAPNGSITLGFAPGVCANTPLTTAQMLDPSYNFDAVLSVTGAAAGSTAQTVSARAMLTAGNCTPWTQGLVAQTMMCADDSTARTYDIGFGDGYHPLRPRFYATFWPTTHQVFVRVIAENDLPTEQEDLAYTATVSLGATSPDTVYAVDLTNDMPTGATGLSVGANEAANYVGALTVTGTPSVAPTNGAAYLVRDVTTGENFTARYSSTAGWSATGRGVWSTAGVLTAGDALVFTPYGVSGMPKEQWAMSNWTKTFWLNGAPPDQVNVNPNVAFLAASRFLPNYDTTIAISQAQIATEYALWSGRAHDVYDAQWDGGEWQSAMPTSGARQEIAPYPQWSTQWFYTGDWRMRDMALGMADLAANFPGNLREDVVGKRLSRADAAGSSTGLGRTISITDRPTLTTKTLMYASTKAADKVVFVGPYNVHQPWDFDEAHQPSAFYVQYLLTGDPWYLQEMYLWGGFSAAAYNGADANHSDGRGPGGVYGVINDELRGAAWASRNRAETAFIAPDADPEKAYFTYLMNDALARWEGMLGITGTPYDGTAIKAWGASTGNYYAATAPGPESGLAPPFGNWESNGVPNGKDATVTGNTTQHIWDVRSDGTPIVGTFAEPWMNWYLQYALGRIAELGFAAGPLRAYTGQYAQGMILDSGVPFLIGTYETPVEFNALPLGDGSVTPQPPLTSPPGGFMSTWPEVLSGFTQAFLTGTGWQSTWNDGAGDLQTYAATDEINDDGRDVWISGGLAMMLDAGDPRAAAAWAWYQPNVYARVPWNGEPKWSIIPRTDSNTLPAIPTATP